MFRWEGHKINGSYIDTIVVVITISQGVERTL